MIPVARYTSEVQAEAAASYLRSCGVPAQVVGHHLAEAVNRGLGFKALDVVVRSNEDRARAKQLLEEFDRTPPTPDEGWEDRTEPDLSRLSPELIPDCPSCGVVLPANSAAKVCPSCGEEVDIVSLILDAHGPEALEPCYDEAPAAAVITAPTPSASPRDPALAGERLTPRACSTCGVVLHDAGPRGRCSACGSLYDLTDHRTPGGGWRRRS